MGTQLGTASVQPESNTPLETVKMFLQAVLDEVMLTQNWRSAAAARAREGRPVSAREGLGLHRLVGRQGSAHAWRPRGSSNPDCHLRQAVGTAQRINQPCTLVTINHGWQVSAKRYPGNACHFMPLATRQLRAAAVHRASEKPVDNCSGGGPCVGVKCGSGTFTFALHFWSGRGSCVTDAERSARCLVWEDGRNGDGRIGGWERMEG
jgi:hypothetical protein